MIRIVVDSAADYLVQELEEKGIELVPINILIGERSFEDRTRNNRDRFYELMEQKQEFPKTAQPSPAIFQELFEDAQEKGDEMICILLSSALSGTFQSANIARDMVEYEGIHLIDSLTASFAIRQLAEYACMLRDEGKNVQEIIDALLELRPRIRLFAGLDTLENLKRGGRIGKASSLLGGIMKIKPLISLNEEGISVLGKAMGTKKAISALTKLIEGQEIDPEFPVYLIYTYGTENCSILQEKLQSIGITISSCLQVGATIGSHIGSGAYGLVFVTK